MVVAGAVAVVVSRGAFSIASLYNGHNSRKDEEEESGEPGGPSHGREGWRHVVPPAGVAGPSFLPVRRAPPGLGIEGKVKQGRLMPPLFVHLWTSTDQRPWNTVSAPL